MGEAKKRGPFEERRQQAIERRKQFEIEVRSLPDTHTLRQLQRQHGSRRLIQLLMSAGMVGILPEVSGVQAQPGGPAPAVPTGEQ
jgi:hypothetical protein